MLVLGGEVSREDFERGPGWALEARGACHGDVCVPLPAGAVGERGVDLGAVTAGLRMPVVTDPVSGAAAVGPAVSSSSRALPSAAMPELVLPDMDGVPFDLASLRGQKVLLVAWAPY